MGNQESRITTHGLVLLACLVLFLTGCQRLPEIVFEPESLPTSPPPPSPPEKLPDIRVHVAGVSVENRPIEYMEIGEGQEVILVIASIHGDEKAGTPIAHDLAEYFRTHYDLLEGRKLVVMPVANPDGMAANTRHNANGVDLNRNFPAQNRTNHARFGYVAFSEPESRAIGRVIREYMPDRIVSIHQPLACIDHDGVGSEVLARRMSACCGLPVRKLGPRPGSLGSYCGLELGIPIITLELPEDASLLSADWLWSLYGNALVASVVYPEDVECYAIERKDEGTLPKQSCGE